MKSFGLIHLESLSIPPLLLNDFCVLGSKEQCTQAITYAFNQLKTHQRVENLILIEPPMIILDSTFFLEQLDTIASCGCKIYSYFRNNRKNNLKNYKNLAQSSLVILCKT